MCTTSTDMDLHSGPTSHLDSPKVESSDHRDPTLEHPSELWHYSVDGAAIERKFCFKTFQAAWVRVSTSLPPLPPSLF